MNVVERRTRIEGKDQDLMVTATVVLKNSIQLSDSQCEPRSSVRTVLLFAGVRFNRLHSAAKFLFTRQPRSALGISKDLGGCCCAN
jgi:hypothetical protein